MRQGLGKALGWLGGKMNDATAAVGRALITRWARKWADGEAGPFWTRVYYGLARYSGAITTTLGVLAGALVTAAQWPELLELVGLSPAAVLVWGERLAYAAPVLVSIKLAADQWHSITKPAWLSAPWAVWLSGHSMLVTTVFGAAWGWSRDCGDGGWCDLARWSLFVLGSFAANCGILPRAARAIPPQQVLEALAGLVTAQTPKVEKQALAIEQHPQAGALQDKLTAAALDEFVPTAAAVATVAAAIAPLEERKA